jgi:carboxypeptidase Taq
MSAPATAYTRLCTQLRTITQLQRASAVLGWDQTVMMPQTDAAHSARGKQMEALAGVLHGKATDPVLGQLLEAAELEPLEAEGFLVVREARREFDRQVAIPAGLAQRSAALEAEAYSVWVEARAKSSFATFRPVLERCFGVAREQAQCRADRLGISAPLYNSCLDSFERGMSCDRIDEIFLLLRKRLQPLISRVLDSPHAPSDAPLCGVHSAESQMNLNREIATAIGFPITDGARLDLSVHPFSTSFSPADVRITTRVTETAWQHALGGTMHESGHSFYEMGLGDSALPTDQALSMGVHESQSLFWERHVGLSREFWSWAGPRVRSALSLDPVICTDDALYGAVNRVGRGMIRVEADELTYPMHVILRYE